MGAGRACRAARHPDFADAHPGYGVLISRFQTASLVPAARLRPGLAHSLRAPPEGKRSDEKAHGCLRDTRLAYHDAIRRGACEAPRAPLRSGTRASRRSTVAIFGRGPRFLLRHFLRIRAASFSRTGRNACRAGSRTSRACGYEPQPRDATPRSVYRHVSGRRPSSSRDGQITTPYSSRSQQTYSNRS